MNILVVGAGMYVTGRGTTGPGTVLPALAEYSRTRPLGRVIVAATRPDGAAEVERAAARTNAMLGTSLAVEYRAIRGDIAQTIRDAQIDCAIVCVPDDLHFDVARRLMELDVHCLIVKPLTPTLAEARQLVELQGRRGLYCAVELHKRFDEQNLLVRRTLQQGRLGRPVYMVVAYSQRIGIPLETFKGWSARTNIFQYLGVHYADLIHFLTGMSPRRVSAVGTRGVLAARGIDTWDSVHATIVWGDASGHEFVSQLAIGWIDPDSTSALSDQRFLLVGSEGRFDLDQKDRGVALVTAKDGVETPNPHFSMTLEDVGTPTFQGYGYRSIERYLRDVEDVRAGRVRASDLDATRPSLRQALVSTAVVDAANRSLARDGEWSTIDAAA